MKYVKEKILFVVFSIYVQILTQQTFGEYEIRNLNVLRGGLSFREDLITDYWLIGDACRDDIEKSDVIPSINSDHLATFRHFNSFDKLVHGYCWKFNASLTDDDDFVTIFIESLPMWMVR